MKRPFEVWRRKLWWWLPPLAFCLLNIGAFNFYHSAFAGRVEELQTLHGEAIGDLEALRQDRQAMEDFLGRAGGSDEGIEELYDEIFSTEADRFTKALLEVKSLARQAGLNPTAFNYPKANLEEYGLIKRGIEFSVEGTYDQLRLFINFLELTPQFITLESVSLSDSGQDQRNPKLGIRLVLSTVFADDEHEATSPESSTT